MFDNTVLITVSYYYPLGNTPPVCLTQDLPPEEDGDILCLGCGDARNILFTCFADPRKKLDVTCCDIEPGIHARNILLYSLLIDDKKNANIDQIWNIYYHWKLDKNSVDLLETQAQKLLQMSESLDVWYESAYGACIRFCDTRSLGLVRAYWTAYQLRSLSPSEKKRHLSQLQNVIDTAKEERDMRLKNNVDITGLRSAAPVASKAFKDMVEISKHWWNHGSTSTALKGTDLNPAFLYTSNEATTLHYGLSPLVGFPLSPAYVPIAKGSPFYLERRKSASSTERLVDSAKSHFTQWASAFRKGIENKLMIRVFCGDALAFGLTLRNRQLTGTLSMNLFCDNWTNSPLKLGSDYGNHENSAPVAFDVVDTSNLADHVGPLNLIGVASTLLKYSTSSSLYTEMLVQHDANLGDRLSNFFGVDTHAMALLFGLVLPELYTNAMDNIEDDMFKEAAQSSAQPTPTTNMRTRLRWKRLQGCEEFRSGPYLNIEAKALAKLLIQLHESMFKYEDPNALFSAMRINPLAVLSKSLIYYNRSSFALSLNLLRSIVISDWDQCVDNIYQSYGMPTSMGCIKMNSWQDLLLNMYLFGVDNGTFCQPSRSDVHGAILAPVLPISLNDNVPAQLCVTVRVSREKLENSFPGKKVDEMGTPAIVYKLEGEEPGETRWLDTFSAVQIAFGTWHAQTDKDSSPYIIEDGARFHGTGDMFVSVFVPTMLLLRSKRSVPLAKVGFMSTAQNSVIFVDKFGLDLCFVRENMTSENVFITRFMPGMPGLPVFAQQNNLEPILGTDVQLTYDGSKVKTLTRRINIKCPSTKAILANKSSEVKVEFQSPLTAVIKIAQSERIKFKSPLPLSDKSIIRVARKSSYIEIDSPLFDPLQKDASMFIFPVVIMADSTTPTLWTCSRLNLDMMPAIDLKDPKALSWLNIHTTVMFSNRERCIRESSMKDFHKTRTLGDTRVDLKEGLFSIFMQFSGLQSLQTNLFALSITKDAIQTFILPSSLCLDLINRTVVLDAAIIPFTDAMRSDHRFCRFVEQLMGLNISRLKVTKAENCAWKALLPACVERCRTWKHNSDCEYVIAGEVPLSEGLNKYGVRSFCACGVGKFPPGYLKNQLPKLSELRYVIEHYGTRAAIGPIFPVPYVEDCFLKGMVPDIMKDIASKCAKCGDGKLKLLTCSRCRVVKYCSKECQKADYKKHKLFCTAA